MQWFRGCGFVGVGMGWMAALLVRWRGRHTQIRRLFHRVFPLPKSSLYPETLSMRVTSTLHQIPPPLQQIIGRLL